MSEGCRPNFFICVPYSCKPESHVYPDLFCMSAQRDIACVAKMHTVSQNSRVNKPAQMRTCFTWGCKLPTLLITQMGARRVWQQSGASAPIQRGI